MSTRDWWGLILAMAVSAFLGWFYRMPARQPEPDPEQDEAPNQKEGRPWNRYHRNDHRRWDWRDGALDELVMSMDRALLLLTVAAVGVFLLIAGMR